MTPGIDQVSPEELARYRERIEDLRGVSVDASEKAIREIMSRNSAAQVRIDAALAALASRHGESASEHLHRIKFAVGLIVMPINAFEGR
jgi:hypothetical protein